MLIAPLKRCHIYRGVVSSDNPTHIPGKRIMRMQIQRKIPQADCVYMEREMYNLRAFRVGCLLVFDKSFHTANTPAYDGFFQNRHGRNIAFQTAGCFWQNEASTSGKTTIPRRIPISGSICIRVAVFRGENKQMSLRGAKRRGNLIASVASNNDFLVLSDCSRCCAAHLSKELRSTGHVLTSFVLAMTSRGNTEIFKFDGIFIRTKGTKVPAVSVKLCRKSLPRNELRLQTKMSRQIGMVGKKTRFESNGSTPRRSIIRCKRKGEAA